MQREELDAWLRLTGTIGIGNRAARQLLAAFGLPQAVLSQDLASLSQVLGTAQAQALLGGPAGHERQLDLTLEWLGAAPSRRILAIDDPDYPASLLQTQDPPLMIYLMGAGAKRIDTVSALAIVGSRNPTPQGLLNAEAFSRTLGDAGLCIVSGLALGVDGAAHIGALQAHANRPCQTIAVVGTGLDRVYPQRHLGLAHDIAEHGLLVSEYPIGTPPLAANFPRRNRIISGLTQGTLVVEAALQSGSLITARMAAEQGREVFAIPGSIHSAQSHGCHALIRQGAKLVESAQDVLEELQRPPARTTATSARSPARDPLLEAMGLEPIGLDELIARTGMAASALQARLLELELAGSAARMPGGRFQQLVRV
jgi:DNA processing protein